MFKQTQVPMIGVNEIKEHLEKCSELCLTDSHEEVTPSLGQAMRTDMAILYGMVTALLAVHEVEAANADENGE